MNAETPSRPRRSWKRRLAILVGVIVLLVVVAPLSLALPFVRNTVAEQMSESIGRPVTIKDASAFWFRGVTLEGIRVESPEGFTEPLATIRRIRTHVNLLAMLTGRIDATIEIEEPWISFQEDAEGRRNTEGLFPDASPESTEPTEPGERPHEPTGRDEEGLAGLDLRLQVRGGVLRAWRPDAELPDEVRDVNLHVTVDETNGFASTFRALAMRAGVGGDDVAIEAEGHIPADASRSGKVRVRVPPLDLARMRHLMRGAAGISDLGGTIEVSVDGELRGEGAVPFAGRFQTVVQNLALRLEDESPIRVRDITMDWDLDPDDPNSAGRAVLEAEDLVIGPGSISHRGHREPKITVRLNGSRVDNAYVLTFEEAQSSIFRAGTVPNEPPLRIAIEDERTRAEGVAQATIQLAPLARAVGAAMGLEPSDTMAGVLSLTTRARVDEATTRMDAVLTGRQIVLPASWGTTGLPPAQVDGRMNVELGEDVRSLRIPSLKGFGLDLAMEATMREDALRKATLRVGGQLAEARPLLGAFMDLEPRESLRGQLDITADILPLDDGHRIQTTSEIQQLRWNDGQGRLIVNEPRITLTKDVYVEQDGRSFRIDAWKLMAGALQVQLEGAARGLKGGYDLDATATLAGDAARIAPTLARFLGEDYADMTGEGQVAGRIALRGPTTNGGQRLLANGEIKPGSWSAGGLTLTSPALRLSRASADVPQSMVVESGVNDGQVRCLVTTQPNGKTTPWTVALDLKQVDTSPLLVDRGLGQYLTYLLPTLLPADTATQVLSGRLDTDVKLHAADMSGDVMTRTLTGAGEIKMTGGSIGQSTLFRVAGSRGGLGQAGQLLARAVPEVGRELEGLAKAMTFKKVESRFDIGQEIVKIRHGLLEGDSAKIGFQGIVRFDEQVDLDISVTLGGRGGEALRPVLGSATVPLDVKGTLEKPRVTPTIDASRLAGGALEGLLPGGKGKDNPLNRLKDLIPR